MCLDCRMSGPDIEHTQTVERTFSNANMLLYWISNLQVKAIFLTISASLFVAIFFSSRLFHSFSPFRERKQKENFLCTRNKQTKKHVYVSDSRIIQWANRMQCHIYNSPIAADNNNNNGEDDGSRARFVRDKNHIAQLKDISYIYSTYLHSPSRFLLFPFWLLLLRQQPLSLLVRPSHTFSVARRQIKISKHISKNQHRLCRG